MQTDRLALPLLAAGQAQKEIAHNEALLCIDMLCQPTAESADVATPSGSPTPGQCWIVAAPASGDWAGLEGAIAGWTGNGWRFAMPSEGWRIWVTDRNQSMRFDGSAWMDEDMRADGYFIDGHRVVAAQQAAIADPAGGSTSDSEARSAIAAVLAALRAHGLIAT